MSALPTATPVTAPLALTLATLLFDEDQLARLVTDCVVASDKVAVAENWMVAPATGADPETATETTVGADGVVPTGEGAGGDGEFAQASSNQPAAAAAIMTAAERAAHLN